MSAAVVGAYGPMLGPGFVPISAQLGITVEVLSQATAWLILTLGICVFFVSRTLIPVTDRRKARQASEEQRHPASSTLAVFLHHMETELS